MPKSSFRDYDTTVSHVKETYQKMQEKQTLAFVHAMKKQYATPAGYTGQDGKKIEKPLMDVFAELDKIIDESDPDTGLPQIYHAYQTGEALKALCDPNDLSKLKNIPVETLFSEQEWCGLPAEYQSQYHTSLDLLYPEINDWSWLPLVGFIHDLGKVLAAKAWGALPQYAVVGDTFPLGAPFSPANVYYRCRFFEKNPDINLQSQIYPMHCGFKNVEMSWGHDEYLYSVLSRTLNHLPLQALNIIRYHSFYPWHTPRDGVRAYTELASFEDWLMLPLLKAFQRCDLYSKQAQMPNVEALKDDYVQLLERFIPGRVQSDYHLRPTKIRW